ncbi:endosialin-like [Stomoxys calcitrans]|uniref:Uncharacterized protein n=1 Tax=Stomoxys calcitrans TaxID=35570 RepID=A0A1I8PM48_STOCA|nr:endosialin-like [Stomoxys calcitrans]
MKVFALTLVAALTFSGCCAVELKKNATEDELRKESASKGDKELHKRGVFHYGTLAAHTNPWPRSYAAHYGYGGVHLPAFSTFSPSALSAAHIAVPGALKYNTAVHYKALSSPFSPAGVTGLNSVATPFVIRPGGAVVQSYSVNYPHHRPNVAIKTFPASPVTPVHVYQGVFPAAQSFETVQPAPVQPVQPVPIQPAHSVVQVQHVKPILSYDQSTQQLPTFFQTSFVHPAPTSVPLPLAPHVPALAPAQPAFSAIPSFAPNFPAVTTSTVSNSLFPVNVQPPLPQQPTTFVTAQVPTLVPVPGTPNQNRPDFGSAEAAPQIPSQPTPEPHFNSELPAQQPTQQPWKPVLYLPPNVGSEVHRPSNTLLPPYGSSPAEGYLPPAPSSSNHKQLNEELQLNRHFFDNLSDADIQHIFHQANLAAQSENGHTHDHAHTVHTYHSHY